VYTFNIEVQMKTKKKGRYLMILLSAIEGGVQEAKRILEEAAIEEDTDENGDDFEDFDPLAEPAEEKEEC
jgi:hypothetical protein